MFFTFWGLNVLRKSNKVKVKKSFIESMFGGMMPRGTGKLTLSKLNMAGMGTAMMKMVMKKKNVDSLETLIQKAMKAGVKIVACTMSMDIMGIKEEELIDGIELGGRRRLPRRRGREQRQPLHLIPKRQHDDGAPQ
jgi:peroxiredoxin family protein